jgi:hypothetical protein
MGTARSDAGAARGLFAKGWNQEKLEAIVGPGRAKAVMKRIEAENAFQGAKNEITGNSVTARATAAQKEFSPPNRGQPGFVGRLDQLLGKPVNALIAARDRAVYGRMGEDAAQMLTQPLTSQPVQTLADLAAQRAGIQQMTGPRTLADLMLTSGGATNAGQRERMPARLRRLGDLVR